MAEQLIDFTITKVFEGPSGEGEYGPWQIYNFYTDKTDKKKFSWFGGGKKITPEQGMEIAYMEYEKTKKGEYTNLNVKKLVLKSDEPEPPSSEPISWPTEKLPQPSSTKPNNIINKDASFYVAYAKDIAVAMLMGHGELINLGPVVRNVAKAGLEMMKVVQDNGINMPPEAQKPPQDQRSQKNVRSSLDETLPWNNIGEMLMKIRAFKVIDEETYRAILDSHQVLPTELSVLTLETGAAVYKDMKREMPFD